MSSKNTNKINVPEARAAMDKFKMETAAAASRKKYQVLRVNLSFIAFLPPGAACSGPAEFFKELKIL